MRLPGHRNLVEELEQLLIGEDMSPVGCVIVALRYILKDNIMVSVAFVEEVAVFPL